MLLPWKSIRHRAAVPVPVGSACGEAQEEQGARCTPVPPLPRAGLPLNSWSVSATPSRGTPSTSQPCSAICRFFALPEAVRTAGVKSPPMGPGEWSWQVSRFSPWFPGQASCLKDSTTEDSGKQHTVPRAGTVSLRWSLLYAFKGRGPKTRLAAAAGCRGRRPAGSPALYHKVGAASYGILDLWIRCWGMLGRGEEKEA